VRSTTFRFRLRISPDWDAVAKVAQGRAASLGLAWPPKAPAVRLPRVYALTLAGSWPKDGPPGDAVFDLLALEPPREYPVATGVQGLAHVEGSFGSNAKRLLAPANPNGVTFPKGAFALRLHAEGLSLPACPAAESHAAQPEMPVARFSLTVVLETFAALATGGLTLKHIGADHIVDKYAPPPALAGMGISRWRGDPTYRLTLPATRVEVHVERPASAAAAGD
jgi:hypothetical protein